MPLNLSAQKYPPVDSDGQSSVRTLTVFLIFLLAFLLRLHACASTHIINPDAVWYICQAKALYYGKCDQLPACTLTFLSVYPILVAFANSVCHDWIVAARSVSLVFGTVTMIPLYLLLRQFFSRDMSALSVLIFALIPFLVQTSADIVRDPVYWFFLVLGLYLFVSQMGNARYRLRLFLSSLSLILGAWARVEAVLILFLSFIFLIVAERHERRARLFYFGIPILCVLCFVLFNTIGSDSPAKNTFRVNEIAMKFLQPIANYKILRSDLMDLAKPSLGHPLVSFLRTSRNLVWLIALGTLFTYGVKAFFYPGFIVLLVGLSGIRAELKKDKRIAYIVLLAAGTLFLVYVHLLETWFIYTRFLAAFVFLSCVFIGVGLAKTSRFLCLRLRLRLSVLFLFFFLVLLSIYLPKNLKSREADKVVYRNFGEVIARIEGTSRTPIAGHQPAVLWVSFYANEHCPDLLSPPIYDLAPVPSVNHEQFWQTLSEAGVKYLLWQENYWPKSGQDFPDVVDPEHFRMIGEDHHPDSGRLLLFRVLPRDSRPPRRTSP